MPERKLTVTPFDKGVCHFTAAAAAIDSGNFELSATSLDSQGQALAASHLMSQLQRRLRRLRALDNCSGRPAKQEPPCSDPPAADSVPAVCSVPPIFRGGRSVSLCTDVFRPGGAPLQALLETLKIGQRSSRQWHQKWSNFTSENVCCPELSGDPQNRFSWIARSTLGVTYVPALVWRTRPPQAWSTWP